MVALSAVVITIFFLQQKSFAQSPLGTCNLQCGGQPSVRADLSHISVHSQTEVTGSRKFKEEPKIECGCANTS